MVFGSALADCEEGIPVLHFNTQRARNPPEFAQPRLSRVKGRSSPARGYKFGCVCSYMANHYVGVRWHRPYRNKHTQICTLSLGMTALWPYSNRAVQIRVGFELAEIQEVWGSWHRLARMSLRISGTDSEREMAQNDTCRWLDWLGLGADQTINTPSVCLTFVFEIAVAIKNVSHQCQETCSITATKLIAFKYNALLKHMTYKKTSCGINLQLISLSLSLSISSLSLSYTYTSEKLRDESFWEFIMSYTYAYTLKLVWIGTWKFAQHLCANVAHQVFCRGQQTWRRTQRVSLELKLYSRNGIPPLATFRKGVRVATGIPGGGVFGAGFRWVFGGGFPGILWKVRQQGEWGWGGFLAGSDSSRSAGATKCA